jgi:hypothetical protein
VELRVVWPQQLHLAPTNNHMLQLRLPCVQAGSSAAAAAGGDDNWMCMWLCLLLTCLPRLLLRVYAVCRPVQQQQQRQAAERSNVHVALPATHMSAHVGTARPCRLVRQLQQQQQAVKTRRGIAALPAVDTRVPF